MFLIPQEVAPAPRDSGELRMALQWEIPLPLVISSSSFSLFSPPLPLCLRLHSRKLSTTAEVYGVADFFAEG